MRVELSQAELNELIYALGYTQMYGKLLNKEVADRLDDKLYKALATENLRIQDQLEQDEIRHEMNFKRKFIQYGDY